MAEVADPFLGQLIVGHNDSQMSRLQLTPAYAEPSIFGSEKTSLLNFVQLKLERMVSVI